MVRLPPRVPHEAHVIELVQRTHETCLHLDPPPLFFLVLFRTGVCVLVRLRVHIIVSYCTFAALEVPALAIEHDRERLKPVEYVYHPSRLDVPPERDARVGQFPERWLPASVERRSGLARGARDACVRTNEVVWVQESLDDCWARRWIDEVGGKGRRAGVPDIP